jgi:hypothetical protein
MFASGKQPVTTRFDVVRTVASVVTALCLLSLTIGFFVAGAYTANTVSTLQSTYHPERLGSILSDASDTIQTIHQTTNMLKSSKGDVTLVQDLHALIRSVQDLAAAIPELHINQVLKESTSWRDMSTHLMDGLKKTLEH